VADIVSSEKRSRMMSGIKGTETELERAVRRALYAKGFRYRKNVTSLPGRPDIVLRKYNAAIFVNGCFWHAHECASFRWPASRKEFWREKLGNNRKRDQKKLCEIQDIGFRTAIVWGCALIGKQSVGIDTVAEALSQWLVGDEVFLELKEVHL